MNLRQVDLNLLVALDTLLTERNVTRAGERLYLSQPAMSGILARLRHLFGDELLVRVGRHLELTAFAAEIAGPVHECMQQIEDLLNAKRPFVPATDSRSFRIAASDYITFLMFGPLMRRLSASAPNMSLRFVALDPAAGDRVAAGDIDFVILPAEVEPGLPSAPLFDDSWVCLVCTQHPTVKDAVTLEEFLALPHLTYNLSGPQYASIADEHFARSGYERRIVASTGSFAMAPFLVHGTTLITLVPRRLGERLQQAAGVRLVEPPVAIPPLREKLVWNPRFSASAAHVWMREQLLEVAKEV